MLTANVIQGQPGAPAAPVFTSPTRSSAPTPPPTKIAASSLTSAHLRPPVDIDTSCAATPAIGPVVEAISARRRGQRRAPSPPTRIARGSAHVLEDQVDHRVLAGGRWRRGAEQRVEDLIGPLVRGQQQVAQHRNP